MNTRISLRLPVSLLKTSRTKATQNGVDHCGYIRTLIATDCGLAAGEVEKLPSGGAAMTAKARKASARARLKTLAAKKS